MLRRSSRLGERSPFAAAFLSFIFPGLGQAYAGLYARAFAFAILPLLAILVAGAFLLNQETRPQILAYLTSPTVLLAILAANAGLLFYRAVAILDAYRSASYISDVALHGNRLGRPRRRLRILPLIGLTAVLLVMSAGHVAAARYNLLAYDLVTSLGRPAPQAGTPPAPPSSQEPGASAASPLPSPRSAATPLPTDPPLPPWNGRERLNILLIGIDRRPDQDVPVHTDTLILASVDPVTGDVAMLSLPRDTIGVPLPEEWPAHAFYGGAYPRKINGLWSTATKWPTLFPGDDDERGYIALKGALGELYQLDIRYHIEVDFQGFKSVIDTLGGVMIDVEVPVVDNHYPSDDGRGALNLYIPAGIQHMDGAEALAYARARHTTSDFDRAARQQRVLLALREQTDISTLLAPGRLDALAGALRDAVRTDIPPELFPQLVSLAQGLDLDEVEQLVFTPPLYGTECEECYWITPNVDAIRRAIRETFEGGDRSDEAERAALASEAASVWVLNGSGLEGQATRVSGYLSAHGIGAEVPTANGGRADHDDYEEPVITVYNGAEERIPDTIRVLERELGVTAEVQDDAGISVDVIVITGSETPDLTPPPE